MSDYKVSQAPFNKSPINGSHYAPPMAWHLFSQMELDEGEAIE